VRFSVEHDDVATSPATDFQKGSCRDLSKHDQVTVSGARSSDGTVLATLVVFEKK